MEHNINIVLALGSEIVDEFPSDLIAEFIKFMLLKRHLKDVEAPGLLAPPYHIDQVWHNLMLRPRQYDIFCKELFRGIDIENPIIDHIPAPREGSDERLIRSITLRRLKFDNDEAVVKYWLEDVSDIKPEITDHRQAPKIHEPRVDEDTAAEENSSEVMVIFVKNTNGVLHMFKVRAHTTIRDLKHQIYLKLTVSPDQQRLIYAGYQWDDDAKTMMDMGIERDSQIDLVLRLRGC